jgi:hypothetical protein
MTDPVEEFELYRKELLEALDGREPLPILRDNIGVIDELLAQHSEEDFVKKPAEGEWSAVEVLRHLVDTELVHGVRIRMIVTQDKPVIVGYDQDAWMNRFGAIETAPTQLADHLRTLRQSNLSIYQTLTEEELDRIGLHTERGEESARILLQLLGGHDVLHVEQMRRALESA